MPVHLRTWEAHDSTTAALLALEPQRQERRRSECKECGSGPWHMCECGGEHSQTRARFDLEVSASEAATPLPYSAAFPYCAFPYSNPRGGA